MLLRPTKVKGAMMRIYTQLTREQKYQIYALMKAGHLYLVRTCETVLGLELRDISWINKRRLSYGLSGAVPVQNLWYCIETMDCMDKNSPTL